jgi:ATP/maltotriose-dependent transcriptional regulator MalT
MLNFASNEPFELSEINYNFDYASTPTSRKIDVVKILAEKISLPATKGEVERQRLFTHLEKSLSHFASTLVTGRVGTGKTTLAVDFANQKNCAVAWYKIETADSDWKTFLGYLTESLCRCQDDSKSLRECETQFDDSENLSVTESLAARFAAVETEKLLLVVLDDLHSVYDADWFGEFFNAILSLPTPNVQVLMLARSAPSFPLWRMRSKHALDVVDEKLLAFTVPETIELFRNYQLSENAARVAHKRAYGRIAKLREIAEKKAIQ